MYLYCMAYNVIGHKMTKKMVRLKVYFAPSDESGGSAVRDRTSTQRRSRCLINVQRLVKTLSVD